MIRQEHRNGVILAGALFQGIEHTPDLNIHVK
jgi:hypothetical protein